MGHKTTVQTKEEPIVAQFAGLDGFNRAVFKGRVKGTLYYFCVVDVLFSTGTKPTAAELEGYPVYVKSRGFNGEPSHQMSNVTLRV